MAWRVTGEHGLAGRWALESRIVLLIRGTAALLVRLVRLRVIERGITTDSSTYDIITRMS